MPFVADDEMHDFKLHEKTNSNAIQTVVNDLLIFGSVKQTISWIDFHQRHQIKMDISNLCHTSRKTHKDATGARLLSLNWYWIQ